LIDRHIGTDWRVRLDALEQLKAVATDDDFMAEFQAVKIANKQQLARYVKEVTDITIRPDSLYDVQIKRMHEYKRQLLNVLQVITRSVVSGR
jgi:starch phosphorylase